MSRWPIERRWRILANTNGEGAEILTTADLLKTPVCCLIGPAGSGKSFELAFLGEHHPDHNADVRCLQLGASASTPDGLAAALEALSDKATNETVICLDAVDEAMVPVVTTGQILEQWIDKRLRRSRPHIRVSCRSAVWPRRIEAALRAVYGDELVRAASLEPLSDADIQRVSTSEGVDGKFFYEQIQRANVIAVARQPLTLRMLIRLFRQQGRLASNRKELFARAVEVLSSEREERREIGTTSDIPPPILIDAAERLACLCALSGCDVIDLGDEPRSGALGWLELSRLPSEGRALDERLLRALASCGLCDGDGPNRFRFIHRQITEYLAGRRIATLLPHQARSLLASSLGAQAGVAGPLREVAAFAASENVGLAQWVAESDPEVIGLSDVADETLRRRATLGFLGRFRMREMTDGILHREGLPLAGLRYNDAHKDLRAVLDERGDGCEDVLELAIEIIAEWGLLELHEALADLVLDPTCPLHPRISAGYVLKRQGLREVKRRLKPLIAGSPADPDAELKGLALHCCWPDDLSDEELLAELTPWRDQRLHGAYFGFVCDLDRAGFDARGDRLAGLLWAKEAVGPELSTSPTDRIVQRIAHGAISELDDLRISGALCELLIESARRHTHSPLDAIKRDILWQSEVEAPAPLIARPDVRRPLLGRLAACAVEADELGWIAHQTPGLVTVDDFIWLLENAVDPSRNEGERERYAEFARVLPIFDSYEAVEAWLKYRDHEPIRARLDYPLSVDLHGEEAIRYRRIYAMQMRRHDSEPQESQSPPPDVQVRLTLELAETKDPRFFFHFGRNLNQAPGNARFELQRFLTETSGWKSADGTTRARIIKSAKSLLTEPSDDPEMCRTLPLNTVLVGHMLAVWLLFDEEPAWLELRPIDWWRRWCWYFLRELHLRLSGEPDDKKARFFGLLYDRAGAVVVESILELCRLDDEESKSLCIDLLQFLERVPNRELDDALFQMLDRGKVASNRIWNVSRFMLRRDYARAIGFCRERLGGTSPGDGDDQTADLARLLLVEGSRVSWEVAMAFLGARPDLAKEVLAAYSNARDDEPGRARDGRPGFTPTQVAELVGLLIEHFPPESDVNHQGVFGMTEWDPAAFARDRWINMLSENGTGEALVLLR